MMSRAGVQNCRHEGRGRWCGRVRERAAETLRFPPPTPAARRLALTEPPLVFFGHPLLANADNALRTPAKSGHISRS